MSLKLSRFDAAKHFETPEDQAYLINDALQSGDAGYISNAIGIVARARGISHLSRETGLSRAALYSALSENGNPTLDTVLKVVRALGLALHVDTDDGAMSEQTEVAAA